MCCTAVATAGSERNNQVANSPIRIHQIISSEHECLLRTIKSVQTSIWRLTSPASAPEHLTDSATVSNNHSRPQLANKVHPSGLHAHVTELNHIRRAS